MHKNLQTLVFALLLILAFTFPVQAAAPQIVLDGKNITFDVPPVLENNTVLVPMRAIFEAQGATVTWDDAAQTVTATRGNTTIKLVIGGKAYVNGKEITLGVPAKLISNRTMVPLRFISETLGANVKWDDTAETVTIASKAETPAKPSSPDNSAAPTTPEKPSVQPTPFEQYLNTLPIDASALASVDMGIHFVITGDDAGEYDVQLKGGKVVWSKGKSEKCKATITTKEKTWLDIASGKVILANAYLNGDITVAGSTDTVINVASVFIKSNN